MRRKLKCSAVDIQLRQGRPCLSQLVQDLDHSRSALSASHYLLLSRQLSINIFSHIVMTFRLPSWYIEYRPSCNRLLGSFSQILLDNATQKELLGFIHPAPEIFAKNHSRGFYSKGIITVQCLCLSRARLQEYLPDARIRPSFPVILLQSLAASCFNAQRQSQLFSNVSISERLGLEHTRLLTPICQTEAGLRKLIQ